MSSLNTASHDADPLIACHACDALLREAPLASGGRARCPRCNAVLTAGPAFSIDGVIACAFATIALLGAALFLPFLSLSAAGLEKDATLMDAARAAGRSFGPLAIAVAAVIAAAPLSRAIALLYVLIPLRLGRTAAPGARTAFRYTINARPWSMVEIFIIGVIVSLVKVAGLASVGLGAAFWIFVCLAGIAFFEDAALCRRSIWRMLG